MRREKFTSSALKVRNFSGVALKALKRLPGSQPVLSNFGSTIRRITNYLLG
jgi:hypothetical protein